MSKTDIAMIADIRTEERTREQIDAQLRQKISGFHKEASRRYKPLGYNLKRVEVLKQDAGKCVIVTDLMEPAEALRLQGFLTELWNQIAWPDASSPSGPYAAFELLVEELVDLGCSTYRHDGGPSNFWLPGEGARKNPRVVEIGRELYELGNKGLEKMREAADRVEFALGPGAANDLSHHWHEIGLEEWKQGKGECWLA